MWSKADETHGCLEFICQVFLLPQFSCVLILPPAGRMRKSRQPFPKGSLPLFQNGCKSLQFKMGAGILTANQTFDDHPENFPVSSLHKICLPCYQPELDHSFPFFLSLSKGLHVFLAVLKLALYSSLILRFACMSPWLPPTSFTFSVITFS